MANSKFDKRLVAEVERLKRIGRGIIATSATEPIPVIVEHKERLENPKAKSRKDMVKELRDNFCNQQKAIFDKLRSMKIKCEEILLSNSILVKLNTDQLDEIKKIPEVKKIRLHREDIVTCLNRSIDVIEVRDSWNLGYTGQGVKVAILDSGVDTSHPALRVKDNYSTVPYEDHKTPGDHGTHVAGIVASQDQFYKGIAPNAELYNVKVLNSRGGGEPNFVVNGIYYAIFELEVDVINLSLGWNHFPYPQYWRGHEWECDDGDCILCRAADMAVEAGAVVVVAAGNENTKAGKYGADTNLGCPGNARKVITVGSVDENRILVKSSSRGPASYGEVKPDLCAPGVNITSCITNNRWDALSGTSMASPHVAGAAALLIEKFKKESKTYTPKHVKLTLKHWSDSLGYTPNEQGKGLLNAFGTLM